MSWLFKIEGKNVSPNVETLLTPPFKEIWERDTSEDKWIAIKEFTYIEFMTSQLKSNPYKGYVEKVREEKIREDIIKDDTWNPDVLVEEAMKKIIEIQTNGSSSYRSFITATIAKNNVEKFLEDFKLEKTTGTGALVLKPKDVTAAIIDLERVALTFENLKKKVEEDMFETVKTRANKTISIFADPNSIND